MKLILGAVIATALVIIIGVLIISPVFFTPENSSKVMLSFTISDQPDLENWCIGISNILSKKNIGGTIFISGKTAEGYPACVNSFSTDFDIGSQTYSYISLNQISDYSMQLEEVQKGRESLNTIGNLDSKLFKAPYGDVNDNVYSLLSRNEILADFSYSDQFNKFHDGKFLKFDLKSFNSGNISPSTLDEIKSSGIPVQVEFESSIPLDEIEKVLTILESANVEFVNASDLTNLELTRRN